MISPQLNVLRTRVFLSMATLGVCAAPIVASSSAPPLSIAPPSVPAAAPAAPVESLSIWLEETLRERVAATRVPALAAVVLRNGEVVAEAAAGVRCEECDSPVTTDDLWHIGSCTKAMTATLVAVLVAEGRLSWDLTLEKAFPAWAERMRPEHRSVTLRDLLRMRGRIPGTPPPAAWAQAWALEGTPTEQRRRFGEAVLTGTEPLPPDRYEYSNQAYSLAGLICEEAAGEPFEQLVVSRLAAPLGMGTLGFGPPPALRSVPNAPAGGEAHPCAANQPCGHSSAGKSIWPHLSADKPSADKPPADNPPALSPAGRVHLSMRDWSKFALTHLRGERDGEPRLGLDGAMFRTLHEPAPTLPEAKSAPYASGWVVRQHDAFGRILWHNGSNSMWYTEMWLAPEHDLAVVVACNRAGEPGERAVRGVLASVLKRLGESK